MILLQCWANTGIANAQTFDTDSVDAFWRVVEEVKSDRSISDGMWSEFRNQEANKIWFGLAVKLDANYELYYRNAIEIVFQPSRKQELSDILKLPKSSPRNLQNIFVAGMYENYYLKQDKIKEFYKKVKNDDYLATVYNLSLTMLPKNYKKPVETLKNLKIYVHCIENGATAGKYGLIFSAAGLYNFEKDNLGILAAHELHHILRKSNIKDDVAPDKEYAVRIMESCLNEGSADLINNSPVFSNPEFAELKGRTLANSEEKIRTIDGWFSDGYKNKLNSRTTEDVNKLFDYLGGHNPGYFMSSTIVKNGFRNQLRETVDNPFEFFLLYQKAAKIDKNVPRFSVETIKFIKALNKKYYRG